MLPKGSARLLAVNLSDNSVSVREYDDQEIIKKTLGGRGLATYIYFSEYDPTLDPMDERAPLIFASGMLTGTCAPSAGRTSVIFKSPATNSFFKSNVGGHFGGSMKFAGYDLIIVTGKAAKPSYIYIEDDDVQILDAEDIWGLDARQVNAALKGRYSDENLQLACIGPAGERGVMFASINTSIYNAAARGGGGAVMGGKMLKCIAVRGTHAIGSANPSGFYKVVERVSAKMDQVPGVIGLTAYGTSVSIAATNMMECLPTRNFQQSSIKGAERISGQYLVESGLLKNRIGCFGCPVCCHRYCTVEDGPFKGAFTGGPEYETFSALGCGCGTTDAKTVIRAGELCNIYGMDVISTGSVIQWLFECKQRGVMTDEEAGVPLEWGNGESIVALTRMIGEREGIGDLLANGVKIASEKLGQDSYKWAVQAKGLEQSRIETRSAYSYALAFAVNSRGPDHLNTEPLAEFGGDPVSVSVIKKITGSEQYAYPTTTEKRPEIVRWHEDIYAAGDSMGICAFPTTAQFWIDESDLAELVSEATGIPITAEEVMRAGQRTILLERMCIGVMGHDRRRDILPYRLMNEVQPGARHENAVNSPEMLESMKDRYYALHGWDIETGLPVRSAIQEIDLSELIPKYEAMMSYRRGISG